MIENNKIYVGNVSDVLYEFDSNYFDIIVLSPPYNKQKVSGKLVKKVEYKDNSDNMPEDLYQQDQKIILEELRRVTKPGGHIFYNHKIRWQNGKMIHPMEWLTQTSWNIRQEIVWDRGIAANIRGWRFWQTEERIYWMQNGISQGEELESRHAKMTSIWKIRPESGFKEHPAVFPIELPTRCIYSVADNQKGLNILDPYCGVGSTLVAASALGHNYVGIDCSQEYVDIANNRINNLNNSKDIVKINKELNLHKVTKSYQERKK